MKKQVLYILIVVCMVLSTACSMQKDDKKKVRDIDFTVVDSIDLPEEISAQIEELKEGTFEITYGDNGYLYIAKGYGKQESTGYSVSVQECYETKNTICMKTELSGPPKDEEILDKETYPYIVIKIEYTDKNVVFD